MNKLTEERTKFMEENNLIEEESNDILDNRLPILQTLDDLYNKSLASQVGNAEKLRIERDKQLNELLNLEQQLGELSVEEANKVNLIRLNIQQEYFKGMQEINKKEQDELKRHLESLKSQYDKVNLSLMLPEEQVQEELKIQLEAIQTLEDQLTETNKKLGKVGLNTEQIEQFALLRLNAEVEADKKLNKIQTDRIDREQKAIKETFDLKVKAIDDFAALEEARINAQELPGLKEVTAEKYKQREILKVRIEAAEKKNNY